MSTTTLPATEQRSRRRRGLLRRFFDALIEAREAEAERRIRRYLEMFGREQPYWLSPPPRRGR